MLLKGREDLGHVPATLLATMLEEREKTIDEYLSGVQQLVDRIQSFELRYEMPTEDMINELRAGTLQETLDIVEWLMDYERYRKVTARWPQLASSAPAR